MSRVLPLFNEAAATFPNRQLLTPLANSLSNSCRYYKTNECACRKLLFRPNAPTNRRRSHLSANSLGRSSFLAKHTVHRRITITFDNSPMCVVVLLCGDLCGCDAKILSHLQFFSANLEVFACIEGGLTW